jgi:MerR family copper efflux transcriptional regulator
VKALALAHMGRLEERALELQQMIETLRKLIELCGGDHRPNCPIIEELGSEGSCVRATKPRVGH